MGNNRTGPPENLGAEPQSLRFVAISGSRQSQRLTTGKRQPCLRSWLMFYVGTFSPQPPTSSCQRATAVYQRSDGSFKTRLTHG